MNHPYIAVGQEVIYIGSDGKSRKGTIVNVFNADEATIEFDGGSAVAAYSDKNGTNTFHFEQASPKAESKK